MIDQITVFLENKKGHVAAVARRLDARGCWLQGAHAGRPLDRPSARAEQSASLNE